MFNANNYASELNNTVDSDSNKFAYFFEQLPLHEKAALMKKLGDFAETPDAFKSFINGTYAQAQANDGSPAKALGAGSSASSGSGSNAIELKEDELKFINGYRNYGVSKSQFTAINSIVTGVTPVDDEGNIADVKHLKTQLENQQKAAKSANEEMKAELDKVKKQLEDEKKKSASAGSAPSTSAPAAAAPSQSDMVEKSKVKAELDKAIKASEGVHNKTPKNPFARGEDNETKLKNALSEIANMVK